MIYGLVGRHLPHSYSKMIHEFLGKYEYRLFELEPGDFPAFIEERKYAGLNITIPYKQTVLPLCDQVSPLAREIGAVNTLYFKDGKLLGTNTDYQGFLFATEQTGISFENKKILILGSGGTSLTVRKAASGQGASEILVASRTPGSDCVSYDALPRDVDILVNTTPVGMYPENGRSPVSLSDFPNCSGVVDVIYNPLETELLMEAAALGIPHTNGIPMLVAQATAAAEYFTGENFSSENQRIIKELTAQVENIVLIGMPGSGKTTLGSWLAKQVKRTFVDLDREIEKKENRSIPEIFSQRGEDYFRELESRTAISFGKERSQVIATGGGVILREENMKALKQNGRIIFLNRPLSHLARRGRPLSVDENAVNALYEKRLPLYQKYCDITLSITEDLEQDKQTFAGLVK